PAPRDIKNLPPSKAQELLNKLARAAERTRATLLTQLLQFSAKAHHTAGRQLQRSELSASRPRATQKICRRQNSTT
ncbi:hypothetical protein D6817_02350, partial [Candidatus Pacearchaeota archaeon]